MGANAVNVKKVRPYPFPAVVDVGGPKPIEILVVTLAGCVARVQGLMLKVGDHHALTFELPVSKKQVSAMVRVIKTYDRAADAKVSSVERLAEFHFQSLGRDHQKAIGAFITAIGQVKAG